MNIFKHGVMTTKEIAEELGYSVKTVYNKISSGEIPLKKYKIKGKGQPRYSRWAFERIYKDNP